MGKSSGFRGETSSVAQIVLAAAEVIGTLRLGTFRSTAIF